MVDDLLYFYRVYLKEDGSYDMSMSPASNPVPKADKVHSQLANHLSFV